MVVSGPAAGPNNQHPKVIIPFWLVLAHELAHARNNELGTNARKAPMVDALKVIWTSAEEQSTIATDAPIAENSLRSEARLSLRFGHRLRP